MHILAGGVSAILSRIYRVHANVKKCLCKPLIYISTTESKQIVRKVVLSEKRTLLAPRTHVS